MRYFLVAALALLVVAGDGASGAGSTIMLMPGLMCGGTTITASSVLYLPAYNCFLSRASTARYTDSTGTIQTAAANTPRYDYDPTTHTLNGILIEPAATNLLPDSSDFTNNTYWTSNGTPTMAADTTAPDGSLAVSFSSAQTFNGRYKSVAVTNATVYTFSVYFKYVSGSGNIRLGLGSGFIDITPSTGAVVQTSGLTGTPTVTSVGNGWYRCVLSFTTTSTTATAIVYNRDATAMKTAFWGPQVELGSVATSYISTTTAAASRSADIYQQP